MLRYWYWEGWERDPWPTPPPPPCMKPFLNIRSLGDVLFDWLVSSSIVQLFQSNNYCVAICCHSNSGITELPLTLGRLRNCWELTLNGLSIQNVPHHLLPGVARGGSTKHLLAYLRAQLRHCVPYNRMKLMVVGLQVSTIWRYGVLDWKTLTCKKKSVFLCSTPQNAWVCSFSQTHTTTAMECAHSY